MGEGFNRPHYTPSQQGSWAEPLVGEEFGWHGERLQCVETNGNCRRCRFKLDRRRTYEHMQEASRGCYSHFCEPEYRRDNKSVKFVKAKGDA